MTGKARSTNKKHQKVPKRVMLIVRRAYLDKRGGQGMSTMVRPILTLSVPGLLLILLLITPTGKC